MIPRLSDHLSYNPPNVHPSPRSIVLTTPVLANPASLAPEPAAQIVEISVVMPCLNEKDTIGECITRATAALASAGLHGEVIVADNGSSDGSIEIARAGGARVVHQTARGYGAAYMKGIAEARGRFIVMGDSDNTYDFGDLPRLVEPLRQGFDLVMGSRFRGTILPGAMPWANRYLGNPILTGLLNLLFGLRISDAHSGLRAFTRDAYARMQLQTTGMEFASEMVIKASMARLKLTEVPITYYPRRGSSKLQPLGDAWRHVRFMLLFSPAYVFLLPGAAALLLGLLLTIALVRGPLYLGELYVGIHFMVLGSLLAVLGMQMLSFGISARAYAFNEHLIQRDQLVQRFLSQYSLERGLSLGLLLGGLGLVLLVWILVQWLAGDARFSALIHLHEAIAASTLTILGAQIVIASFFISLLSLHRQHHLTFPNRE
jgi:glycosyltransferase involved in cell wall biosynthesis